MQKQVDALIDEFTNGSCTNLARSLSIKTGFPIYAIYDKEEKPYAWGINYFHYFVKVDEDCYLNARGPHTEREMITYWAKAWNDSRPIEEVTYAIVAKEPDIGLTGDYAIDCQLEAWGCGTEIKSHTKVFADLLISAYLPELNHH